MLGFNRTHHMLYVITDPENREMKEWTRALRAKYRGDGTFTKLDWDRLLGDCQAAIDYPSALFAADLAQLYPDTKVIMVNRDPEKWYESVSETVAALGVRKSLADTVRGLWCYLWNQRTKEMATFWDEIENAHGRYDHFKEKQKAIDFMLNSYDECRKVVDEERRLEWKVQDGWAPLCKHLGVDVPMVEDPKTGKMVEAPFPRVNDRAAFQANMKTSASSMMELANATFFDTLGRGATLGVLGYGAYVLYKVVQARR